jgi:hypothetical protein
MWMVLLLPSFVASALYPTGEIEFEQIGPNQLEARVNFYFKGTLSQYTYFTDLEFCWGDGNCSIIQPVNGVDVDADGIPDGTQITDDYIKKVFSATYTYAQPGAYTLSSSLASRGEGIININFPNSIFTPYYVEALAQVSEDDVASSSPQWLEPPIDRVQLAELFVHFPNAYDPDGDSISYSLVIPLSSPGESVPNFSFIGDIFVNPGNIAELTEHGFFWSGSQQPGLYSLTILAQSFRDGELWDESIREMLIEVVDEENEAPIWDFESIDFPIFCVEVGDTVSLEDIPFSDPDLDFVDATITSGLLQFFDNPAIATINNNGSDGTADFFWIVENEHVRDQAYPVVFKVRDEAGLSHKRLVLFKVLDPSTGTNEMPELKGLQLFPNPATAFFEINGVSQVNYDFVLIDEVGRQLNAGQFNTHTQVDISLLPAGLYYVKISNVKGQTVLPLLKIK